MRKKVVALFMLFIILGMLLVGCGGTTRVETQNNVTLGQQLIDLDKAYKDGVISEKEYKKAKEGLLDQY